MAFFILTRFVLVKYSRAFVERPSQGTSSLASRLTTVSLDAHYIYIFFHIRPIKVQKSPLLRSSLATITNKKQKQLKN